MFQRITALTLLVASANVWAGARPELPRRFEPAPRAIVPTTPNSTDSRGSQDARLGEADPSFLTQRVERAALLRLGVPAPSFRSLLNELRYGPAHEPVALSTLLNTISVRSSTPSDLDRVRYELAYNYLLLRLLEPAQSCDLTFSALETFLRRGSPDNLVILSKWIHRALERMKAVHLRGERASPNLSLAVSGLPLTVNERLERYLDPSQLMPGDALARNGDALAMPAMSPEGVPVSVRNEGLLAGARINQFLSVLTRRQSAPAHMLRAAKTALMGNFPMVVSGPVTEGPDDLRALGFTQNIARSFEVAPMKILTGAALTPPYDVLEGWIEVRPNFPTSHAFTGSSGAALPNPYRAADSYPFSIYLPRTARTQNRLYFYRRMIPRWAQRMPNLVGEDLRRVQEITLWVDVPDEITRGIHKLSKAMDETLQQAEKSSRAQFDADASLGAPSPYRSRKRDYLETRREAESVVRALVVQRFVDSGGTTSLVATREDLAQLDLVYTLQGPPTAEIEKLLASGVDDPDEVSILQRILLERETFGAALKSTIEILDAERARAPQLP